MNQNLIIEITKWCAAIWFALSGGYGIITTEPHDELSQFILLTDITIHFVGVVALIYLAIDRFKENFDV